MNINLEGYRNNKIKVVKIPIFSRIYKDNNTVIGEFPNGKKTIINVNKE